ncbi:hypothetical protein LAZ67_22000081 [Cordylochernes scorpioides]|uniref:RNase H type-1 domain-containing protein n=1 Tax=Cordylochernes scorpioides TaxID=51811 RepID=A0ABY6LN05_9ARAC|nr:hypothetical protein LAZ67_22000081 [Cordylochernes scorpioides]
MKGRRVALFNRMTILGVVIDDKMGWQYQAEEMVARGREALDQKVATTLENVQRTAALRITGGYRTTSSEAFLVLAGLIPLGLKLEEETIRQKIWENREDALGLKAGALEWKRDPRKPPQWLPKWNWSPGGPTGIGTEVFTDGTELVAIRVALRVCAEKNFSPNRLYSDCMSALVAINLVKGQLAHQIIQELEMMTRAPELHWVRGHSLIEGNEFADRLAKAGCFRGRSLTTPVTKEEVYSRIGGHVQDLWLGRWRNSVKGREEERMRARGAIESKLLRNHSKLLEKAHDVAAELFLSWKVDGIGNRERQPDYACARDVIRDSGHSRGKHPG